MPFSIRLPFYSTTGPVQRVQTSIYNNSFMIHMLIINHHKALVHDSFCVCLAHFIYQWYIPFIIAKITCNHVLFCGDGCAQVTFPDFCHYIDCSTKIKLRLDHFRIIIESIDSISRDELDVPLTQYITNA